jgi:hypothetical protein
MKEYEWINRSKSHHFSYSWILVIFSILMILASCKEKKSSQDILSPAEMVKVVGEV